MPCCEENRKTAGGRHQSTVTEYLKEELNVDLRIEDHHNLVDTNGIDLCLQCYVYFPEILNKLFGIEIRENQAWIQNLGPGTRTLGFPTEEKRTLLHDNDDPLIKAIKRLKPFEWRNVTTHYAGEFCLSAGKGTGTVSKEVAVHQLPGQGHYKGWIPGSGQAASSLRIQDVDPIIAAIQRLPKWMAPETVFAGEIVPSATGRLPFEIQKQMAIF